MYNENPYQAYIEGDVVSRNPVGLVTALYEGAIQAVQQARRCLATEDIWGRSKAISKAVEILTELILSLDHEKGKDLSARLQELYGYMQHRLLEAHHLQDDKPMAEVEKLLGTMLDGWYKVGEQLMREADLQSREADRQMPADSGNDPYAVPYGYGAGAMETASAVFTF